MTIQCPSCHSHRINTINLGRKVGGASFALGGGLSALSLSANTAKTALTVASMSNPVTAIGGLVVTSLISAAAAGIAGSEIGKYVDENILDNYECLSCGHIFSDHQD